MKFILSATFASVLFIPFVASADFKDVNAGVKYSASINALQEAGVIGGYPDGTFRPNQTINRAELMKILVVGALKINPDPPTLNCFPDVRDEWFAPYVCFAQLSHWVQGYPDGTFRPNNTLTQAEALKMVMVSVGSSDDQNIAGCDTSQWYGVYLCKANRMKLMQEAFVAGGPMTRGLAAAWIQAAISQEPSDGSNQTSSVAATSSSRSTASQGTASSKAAISAELDASLKLSMVEFLGKAEGNISVMEGWIESYNDQSHQPMANQMKKILAQYKISKSQLEYIKEASLNRTLTDAEISQIPLLKAEMNELIDSFNATHPSTDDWIED
jgi:hypothetical protein